MTGESLIVNPATRSGIVVKRDSDNPSVVQALWHSSDLFSRKEAAAWCVDHKFKTDVYRSKEDDDGNTTFHIHAQFDPDEAIEDSWGFVSEDFPAGISASVCQREEKAMEMKYTKGVQSADDPFEFIMSDESVDRMGDVIVAKGWQLTDFKSNPIALWGHDHKSPIGTWEKVRVEGKRLMGRLKLAKEGTSAEIDTLRSLLEQRILRSVSVGFMPVEYEPIDEDASKFWGPFKFLKTALHECSLVSVPANPNALQVGKSFGLTEGQFNRFFNDGRIKGQNAAPLARIEKAIGTANKIAGCPK